MEGGDEEDPVIAEHDIYLTTQLAPYLHILQMPGNLKELEGETLTMACKYKRNHKLLEVELPLNTSHPTFSTERGEEFATSSASGRIRIQNFNQDSKTFGKLDRIKLSGSKVNLSPDSKYFTAVCINGSLHLTPVENVLSMKPALLYLDESDARTKSSVKKLDTDGSITTNGVSQEKLKAVQVQFKKRETEEQIAARLSSYAYLQRQVEEEGWVNITHFVPETQESMTVSERLISTTVEPIEFQ